MMIVILASSVGGVMTEVDLHRAEIAALEAQALIEEARRLHRRRQRKAVIGITVVALLVGVAVSAIVVISHGRSRPSTTALPRLGGPARPENRTAYVTTSSGIVVVDLATGKVVRRIVPHGTLFALDPIAIAPGGHTAYVVSDNVLTPIDLPSGSVKSSITLGPPTAQLADASGYPSSIAIAPDGRTAYVAIPAFGTIVPVHLDSLTVGTPISVGGYPSEIAIAPNGKTAYVPDSSSSRIDVVNLVTDSVESPITGIADPHLIAISPNGQRAYVSSGGISLPPSVVPIDLSTGRMLAPIALESHGFGDVPGFIAVSPDGRTVYVTFAPKDSNNQVFLLSTARNKVIARLGYFSGPGGMALASSGHTLYVLNTAPSEIFGKSQGVVEGDALVPIDLDRGRIEKPISIPATPRSVGIAHS
jgi:DNA-binding beta-propeller fold protein YncE